MLSGYYSLSKASDLHHLSTVFHAENTILWMWTNNLQSKIKGWNVIISKDRAQKTKRNRFHPNFIPEMQSKYTAMYVKIINVNIMLLPMMGGFLMGNVYWNNSSWSIMISHHDKSWCGLGNQHFLAPNLFHKHKATAAPAAAAILDEWNVKGRPYPNSCQMDNAGNHRDVFSKAYQKYHFQWQDRPRSKSPNVINVHKHPPN